MHLAIILGKWPTWRTVLFYVFISVLYMFWATSCSSSGESIVRVSIRHLIYVTVCQWQLGVQVGTFRPAHETVTDTEWHISDVVLIQSILLTMSTRLLGTCRELKYTYRKEFCIKLVIYQESVKLYSMTSHWPLIVRLLSMWVQIQLTCNCQSADLYPFIYNSIALDAEFWSNLPLIDLNKMKRKNLILIHTEQDYGLTTLPINILLDDHYARLTKF